MISITDEHAATAIEYAFMVTLIAIAILVAVLTLGRNVESGFQCAYDTIEAPDYRCPD